MLVKFLKRLQKKGILSMRFMMILTLITVFVASIGISYLVKNETTRINQEMEKLYSDVAELYVGNVNNKIDSYITAMGVVSINNTVRENIFRTDVTDMDLQALGNTLRQSINEIVYYLYKQNEVVSHKIYTYLPITGYPLYEVADIKETKWFQTLASEKNTWWYQYSSVTNSKHISLAGSIESFNIQTDHMEPGYSCQVITIDTNTLFESEVHYGAKVFIFDNESKELVYNSSLKNISNGSKLSEQVEEMYRNAVAGVNTYDNIKVIDSEGNKASYSIAVRQIGKIDATAFLVFVPQKNRASDKLWISYGIAAVSFTLMAILIGYNWLYRKRLNTLIGRMDSFDEKSIYLISPMGGNDELGRLDRHLLMMQGRIHTLIQEEYMAHIQMVTAKQEALMTCINPHFLYNTLNIISAMACMEGADCAADMIGSLSDMFRYSSDVSRDEVLLEEELKNISDYLYIQGLRYQDVFHYQLMVPDELMRSRVPKIILQPLVENVFKHAFKNQITHEKAACKLLIWAEKKEQKLIIHIEDNGSGIGADRLDWIKNHLKQEYYPKITTISEGGSIGIQNTHNRIRLKYGADYGISIDSRGENMGSIVSIIVPYHV